MPKPAHQQSLGRDDRGDHPTREVAKLMTAPPIPNPDPESSASRLAQDDTIQRHSGITLAKSNFHQTEAVPLSEV